ncbi:MAG: SAP domain-containing protein [Candidatus Thalassarchaeaceae archaeon]|jgi:chromosome segregation ATPase
MTEERVQQLEERLAEETQRLEKLYVAYRRIEEELQEKNAIIDVLEKEAIDKEIEREGLESLLSEKDSRIRGLEMDHAKARKRIQHLEPDLEKMEEMYARESARLGRVFEVAEELDESLRVSQAELNARDNWYEAHMSLFEQLNQAIKTRFDMIERAVEAVKDQQQKQAEFKNQMENAQEAVSNDKVEDLGDGLEKMKVAELRAILVEQGMDAKGKKAELIERIRKA